MIAQKNDFDAAKKEHREAAARALNQRKVEKALEDAAEKTVRAISNHPVLRYNPDVLQHYYHLRDHITDKRHPDNYTKELLFCLEKLSICEPENAKKN
jgi:hypothetical protein